MDDLDCPSEDGEAESEYSRRVNGMVEKFDSPSFLDEDVPQLLMDTDDFALVSKPAGLHCSGADGDHGTSRPGRGERPAGRAELLANFFGGAVWGVFRENANCGDPPGTLPVPSRYLPGTLRVPCTFRRGLIWKIRQKSGKIWAKSSKICQN